LPNSGKVYCTFRALLIICYFEFFEDKITIINVENVFNVEM